jgi:arsenite/tail-anchored protein-transporting ATPase
VYACLAVPDENPTTAAPRGLDAILSARVLLVTGKGGTGKTTVAAALASLVSRAGKRVLVAELGQQPARHSPLLEALGAQRRASTLEPQHVLGNVWSVLLTPEAGHRAFLHDVLPFGFLVDRALRAEPLRRFLAAAPAFSELGVLFRGLQFVKAERRRGVPEWDVVIIDAPASGHALAFATLPQILLKVIPGGPIGRTAREGISILTDPKRTLAIIATLPETLPVSEALELAEGLARSNLRVHGIVANQVPLDPFSTAEHEALAALLGKTNVLGSRTLSRLSRSKAALLRLEQAALRILIVHEQLETGEPLIAAVANDLAGAA